MYTKKRVNERDIYIYRTSKIENGLGSERNSKSNTRKKESSKQKYSKLSAGSPYLREHTLDVIAFYTYVLLVFAVCSGVERMGGWDCLFGTMKRTKYLSTLKTFYPSLYSTGSISDLVVYDVNGFRLNRKCMYLSLLSL